MKVSPLSFMIPNQNLQGHFMMASRRSSISCPRNFPSCYQRSSKCSSNKSSTLQEFFNIGSTRVLQQGSSKSNTLWSPIVLFKVAQTLQQTQACTLSPSGNSNLMEGNSYASDSLSKSSSLVHASKFTVQYFKILQGCPSSRIYSLPLQG